MIQHSMHHSNMVFERTYDASIARVLAACGDPVARARWSTPSETAVLIYDEAESITRLNFALVGATSFDVARRRTQDTGVRRLS